MSKTYLVRAKLGDPRDIPQHLPVKFQQFQLAYSPNRELWLIDRGLMESDPAKVLPPETKDYPFSCLYLDTTIDIAKGQHPLNVADNILEQLEAMFRLFQGGNIYLRRYGVWELQAGATNDVIWWAPWRYPVKAEPLPLYERGCYNLNDGVLAKFIDFLNSYWCIVQQKPQPIYNALIRFSSSYEKLTLADRLVDLMIAMEALFGSQEGEVTFKISLRSACMAYPAGAARKEAFNAIKKLYKERSNIVHGKSLTSKSDNQRIDQFEDNYARNSIVKFLQYYKKGRLLRLEAEVDELLFFT